MNEETVPVIITEIVGCSRPEHKVVCINGAATCNKFAVSKTKDNFLDWKSCELDEVNPEEKSASCEYSGGCIYSANKG